MDLPFAAVGLEAAAKFVTQTIFGGHEGFPVVVMAAFKSPFGYLGPMAEVELTGVVVENVGTVVKDGFEIRHCVGETFLEVGTMASAGKMGFETYFFKAGDSLAAQVVDE